MAHGRGGAGLGLALLSGATFATSGTFAASLISAGWSPAAAVTVRIAVAALLLTVPAVLQLRGQWHRLRAAAGPVVAFGLVAVAGCQLAYFNAIEHVSVGIALLLEYLGIVLIVGWLWLRHGRRPRRLTTAGSLVALVGLVLVLDVLGDTRVDPVGVVWGLLAAVGLATYFLLSASDEDPLPPMVLAWAGMAVGALTLGLLALVGALPFHVGAGRVQLLHAEVHVVVPILGLSMVAAVVAYAAGIAAARRLGATVASFLGLSELLFAVLFAWLFLGQLPAPVQLVGGGLIVAGVALVRWDDLRAEAAAARATDPAAAGGPVTAR
ncbi:EamA family transporter [Nakamurella endophytica]|uniref:Membrane protein n=1 Tax=Nakamurella endophytica TaxID=1748367 RepID=A0A917SW86_9ACTN|nr:DMT family transporter [Nakamurella endophytica]GGL99396.1 membrane protein [Nakamurella endophytica]